MATTSQVGSLPELVTGERMSAAEFELRYHASSHIKKAELIDGVVYVASPVSFQHSKPHGSLTQWLGFYQLGTPHLLCCIDGTIRLDENNQPQPDVQLLIESAHGGRTTISEDHYVEGSPELVAEISVSSKSFDLTEKLEAYRRAGALESLVWRVLDQEIDCFVLREGKYERLPLSPDGFFKSEVFPGLWLDPEALMRGDLAAVFQAVQLGLATDEHAAFVTQLQAQAPQ